MAQSPGWTREAESRLAGGCCCQIRPEESRRQEGPGQKSGRKKGHGQNHEASARSQAGVLHRKKNPEAQAEARLTAGLATVRRTAAPSSTKVKRKSSVVEVTSTASAPSSLRVSPKDLAGAVRAAMPAAIYPMLATSIEAPFDGPEWFFEIKWDGYRAIAFVEQGRVRYVSRNQNDLTSQYTDLHDLPRFLNARTAVLDGEIVALDEQGHSSFSLMQQRTGFRDRNRRVAPQREISVLYYAFDLLHLDGYDLRRVSLEQRKQALSSI